MRHNDHDTWYVHISVISSYCRGLISVNIGHRTGTVAMNIALLSISLNTLPNEALWQIHMIKQQQMNSLCLSCRQRQNNTVCVVLLFYRQISYNYI